MQLKKQMHSKATKESYIFSGFQQEKKQMSNRLTYAHWFALYSGKSNPFMPVSGLATLFTVPSAKWKCENWPLFKNIKFFLSSRDTFSACHGVFNLPLMSHSFRQGILLGHVWTLTAPRLHLANQLVRMYDLPAGRSPLPTSHAQSVRNRSKHLPFPWICWPPIHGDGPQTSDYNLCPETCTWIRDG